MSLRYPTRSDLALWVQIAQRNVDFGPYLPAIDDGWIDAIQSDIALCAMHPDSQRIVSVAARLFHRVIKNHHFVDGNKRSAVLILFIFLDANDMALRMNWEEMYDLAKEIAASTDQSEVVVAKLTERFSQNLTPLSPSA